MGFGKLRRLLMLMHACICSYAHICLNVFLYVVACLCMSMLVYLCKMHSWELHSDLQISATWGYNFGKVTFMLVYGCFVLQCSYLVLMVRGGQRQGPFW